MAQFPANIDLSSLNGSNGFKLSGVAADEQTGQSVASAGDVNGDGFADLIVGAPGADPHGAASGASYVVFGRASGFAANLNLSNLNGSNGLMLSGVVEGDASGFSVASAGDVNGDGFADVIVGAIGADGLGASSGASYVVFGKASGFPASLDLSSLNGGNGFRLAGTAPYDFSGFSVASAGDVNGDGFSDLVVGAWRASVNGSYSGQSYVVFGKASGFGANLILATLNGSNGFKLSGAAGDFSGWSVASAGDVNGDGFSDLIVGAVGLDSYSGGSYVVFGKAAGFAANLNLSSLNGNNGFKLSGVAAYDMSGWSVASAGDINSDGFADLIVGARSADPHGSYSGASYVVFGKASGFAANTDLSSLNGGNGFKLSGAGAGDYAGLSVSSAGDVNGDGFDDLIVGAYGADPHGSKSGTSYVVFGKPSGFAANVELSSLNGSNGFRISGVATGDQSGFSVASAGDVNGDGFADLIVGARYASPHGTHSGASYVTFGRAPDTAVNRVGTRSSQTLAGGAFNDALSGLGGDDKLFGNGGSDTLEGGAGDDSFFGGAGNDTANYAPATSGIVVHLWDLDPQFTGDAGTDTLNSIERLIGSKHADWMEGDSGENRLVGGAGDDTLTDYGGDDVLDGGAGNDELDGGPGNDRLIGGDGKDTVSYRSASAGVAVRLAIAGAQDTGSAGADTLIGIENLEGSARADILSGDGGANTLDGWAGDDRLHGGGGSDHLVGGWGADTMDGGEGSDTYEGDRFDTFHDTGTTGTDTVIVGDGNFVLASGSGIENLTAGHGAIDVRLTGDKLANRITGNDGNNTLRGLAGDDFLLGGRGNNILDGGAGMDTADYTDAGRGVSVGLDKSSAQDTGNGIDTLAGIEDLKGSGFGDKLTGNAGANVISGMGGNDTLLGGGGDDRLNGGSGADRMLGGAGNDLYDVDDTGDRVREDTAAGVDDGGTDTVQASVSFTLGSFVENLVLAGDQSIDGTGNALANRIDGNGAANRLSGGGGNDILTGGGGADTMDGGEGSDTYYGDRVDIFHDTGTIGVDTVISTDNLTLASGTGIENLVAGAGTSDVRLTGDERANRITGNDGDNVLRGLAGNDALVGGLGDDRLEGGLGSDVLKGGEGADTFVFKSGDSPAIASPVGYDTIADFTTGVDTIDLYTVGASGLAPSAYSETVAGGNSFGMALNAARAAMADGTNSVVFVAGTIDGWLFWNTNANLHTPEQAVRLTGLNSISLFQASDVI